MSYPAINTVNQPTDLPEDMRRLLKLIADTDGLRIMAIVSLSDVENSKSKVYRLMAMGLVVGAIPAGSRESVYSATPRGRRFAETPGEKAPARTRPYAGTYTPEPWTTWRKGQDAAHAIHSRGYAH